MMDSILEAVLICLSEGYEQALPLLLTSAIRTSSIALGSGAGFRVRNFRFDRFFQVNNIFRIWPISLRVRNFRFDRFFQGG